MRLGARRVPSANRSRRVLPPKYEGEKRISRPCKLTGDHAAEIALPSHDERHVPSYIRLAVSLKS